MCSHESVHLNFCSVNDRWKTKCKIIIFLLARLKHYCSFALWILVLSCCSLGWMKLCEYFWNMSKNHPTLKLINVIFPLYFFFYCTLHVCLSSSPCCCGDPSSSWSLTLLFCLAGSRGRSCCTRVPQVWDSTLWAGRTERASSCLSSWQVGQPTWAESWGEETASCRSVTVHDTHVQIVKIGNIKITRCVL